MKLATIVQRVKQQFYSIFSGSSGMAGWLGRIQESFSGAWQRNMVVETTQNILAFAAVYSCVTMIAEDIAKLRIMLMEQDENGIWTELTRQSPFLPVLRKPNHYQTRIQFLSQWIVSKLLHGNTYVLKERGANKIVSALYILDARYVLPLVTETGDVYYQITKDYLSGIYENVVVPASEIIHDRCITPWHPLMGVTPIYACGMSATQGIRIQINSEKFFGNMSRPSGQLTSPTTISEITANRFKEEFERNFSGGNLGRLLVTGDGLKYEPMTMAPQDAQLIEQLGWTVADVGRAFKMPGYKLGLEQPPATGIGALKQEYYDQTLQIHVESIELLLDEGLGLTLPPQTGLGTALDIDGLLRMDPVSRADAAKSFVGSATWSPNESRKKENLKPVAGGETPFLQQQNFPLSDFAKRSSKDDPFASGPATATSIHLPAPAPTAATPPPPEPTKDEMAGVSELALAIIKRFTDEIHTT